MSGLNSRGSCSVKGSAPFGEGDRVLSMVDRTKYPADKVPDLALEASVRKAESCLNRLCLLMAEMWD